MFYSLAFLSLLSLALAQEVLIGDLVEKDHNVSGTLYAVNTRTLRIDNFYYDGQGPAAAFWVNTDSTATTNGSIIDQVIDDTCVAHEQLRRYTGERVLLELPERFTLADIGYFSVWCIQFKTEFGGIPINASKLENLLVREEANCPKIVQGEMGREFPVRKGWNCEPLSGDYQVRWQLDDTKTNINFELVAQLRNGDQWMGFGPSGSNEKTQMIGSDVAIAFRQDDEFFAIDYHMNAQTPCNLGNGVCPDTKRNVTTGTDDVMNVSGGFKNNITMVRYTRPVKVKDTDLDKDIVIDGPAFVSWALGPLKIDLSPPEPLFHLDPGLFPKRGESVSFEFGREPENKCTGGLAPVIQAPADLPGFQRPVLHNVRNITARIGPAGGTRGVSAIGGRPSWGIAWYLAEEGSKGKDILIPVLGVEREKTYTFKIFGGIPANEQDASVHPFYITSSSVGGYATKSRQQRAKETVFAGIDDIKRDKQGGVESFKATGTGALCRLTTETTDTSAIETYEDYYDTLNRSCVENSAITASGGELVWKVAKNTPDLVYYQCVTHDRLGYIIRVFDSGTVNVTELNRLSGGGPLRTEGSEVIPSCTAEFKGQVRTFQGCVKGLRGNVDLFWSFNDTSQEIVTLFRTPKGTDTGFLGVGWGYTEMPGSNAVIAYEVEGGSEIGDYFLAERDSAGVQPNDNQQLTSSDSDNSGDFLTGIFTRPLEIEGLPPITKGKTEVIWAVGSRPSSPTSFTTHRIRGSGSVDLDTTTPGGTTLEDNSDRLEAIFVAHGVLMGISWLLLVPIAITAMRFFKRYNPVTFNIHRGINGVAGILTVAAFIMAITSGTRTETVHLAIGCIVFGVVILQIIGGAFRPHRDRPLRKPWFWIHALLGSTLSGLGIANCFLGIGTAKIGGPVGWYIVAGAVTGIVVLVQVVLAFMPGTFPRTAEERPRVVDEKAKTGRTFVRED